MPIFEKVSLWNHNLFVHEDFLFIAFQLYFIHTEVGEGPYLLVCPVHNIKRSENFGTYAIYIYIYIRLISEVVENDGCSLPSLGGHPFSLSLRLHMHHYVTTQHAVDITQCSKTVFFSYKILYSIIRYNSIN